MHPKFPRRALAKARHEDLLNGRPSRGAAKNCDSMIIPGDSLVHGSGWARCSFGRAHT